MTTYAQNTSVSVAKSRAEIEDMVTRYGATAFGSAWQGTSAHVVFQMRGRRVRLTLPLPDKSLQTFTHKRRYGRMVARQPHEVEQVYEQACRQRWRALALIVKAKLEAIETGVSSFELEFMANICLPDGGTVGDFMAPQIEAAYQTGQMPPLLGSGT